MRIMAGSTVGIKAGQVIVGRIEFRFRQAVALRTKLADRFDQIAAVGGTMRSMAGVAFPLLDGQVDRAFLEALFFVLMTGITESRPAEAQALFQVGAMRVMASCTLASGDGGMHMFRRQGLGHAVVAGDTQIILGVFEDCLVVAAMGSVTVDTVFLGRRMRVFFRQGFLESGVAAQAKVPAFNLGEALTHRPMRGMTGGAAVIDQWPVSKAVAEAIFLVLMAPGAQFCLNFPQQLGSHGAVGGMAGQAPCIVKCSVARTGPSQFLFYVVVAGKTEADAGILEQLAGAGSMHLMARSTITTAEWRMDMRLLQLRLQG